MYSSAAMDAFVHFLDEKIRMTHVECFVYLVQRYQEVLCSHDWTKPVPCKGVIFSADDAFDAVGSHMYWLASVANDCTRILSRHIDACVEASNGASAVVEMSPENMEQMGQKMYKLTKLLSSTTSCAMDSLTCIVFTSYSEIMPTRNIFDSWTHSKDKTPCLVSTILREQASYLNDVIGQMLEQSCLEKFRELSLRKICVWYLCLIRDAASSGAALTSVDAVLIEEDCASIAKFFLTEAQSGSNSHLSQIDQELTLLTNISNIATKCFGGKEFSGSMYSLIDCATSEKYRVSSLKSLLKALFKFRGTYSEQQDESFLGVDVSKLQREFLSHFDVILRECGGNVAVPKSYQLEPLPDMLVFGMHVNLEEYIVRSAVERGKVLKRIDEKESSTAKAEELRQQHVAKQAHSTQHSQRSHEGKHHVMGSIMNWFSTADSHQEGPAKTTASEVTVVRGPSGTIKSGQNIVEITGLTLDSLYCLDSFINPAVYVEFVVDGKKTSTNVKKNTLSPTWSETFSLTVVESHIERLSVSCTVFYQVRFRRDIRVGTVNIPLAALWEGENTMDIQQERLDCSNSSPAILEAIALEDKHRLPPSISLKLSLGIRKNA